MPKKAEDGNKMHVSSHTEVFKLKPSETAHSVPACPAEKMPSFLCICAIFCWKNDTIVYQSSATAAFIATAQLRGTPSPSTEDGD